MFVAVLVEVGIGVQVDVGVLEGVLLGVLVTVALGVPDWTHVPVPASVNVWPAIGMNCQS